MELAVTAPVRGTIVQLTRKPNAERKRLMMQNKPNLKLRQALNIANYARAQAIMKLTVLRSPFVSILVTASAAKCLVFKCCTVKVPSDKVDARLCRNE